jgi:uncharacterized protein
MKLDLSEIAHNPGMHSVQEIDEACPEEIKCTEPVKGSIRLTNTGTLLLIEGTVKATAVLECGRCLEDFTMPVSAKIEEEFRVEHVGDAMMVLPMEEDEEASELVKNNILDIGELVRQNLLVELPISPVCKPECLGLCPTCGKNRNMRECSCPPAEVESPFHVLADLLDKDKEEE